MFERARALSEKSGSLPLARVSRRDARAGSIRFRIHGTILERVQLDRVVTMLDELVSNVRLE